MAWLCHLCRDVLFIQMHKRLDFAETIRITMCVYPYKSRHQYFGTFTSNTTSFCAKLPFDFLHPSIKGTTFLSYHSTGDLTLDFQTPGYVFGLRFFGSWKRRWLKVRLDM